MRRASLVVAPLLAGALWGGSALAGSDPAAVPSAPGAPPAAAQDQPPLVLSIGAMSLGQPTFTDTGDLDRVKPSNGTGTSRWPSATTPIARGVYISVSPSCIPGVDEPFFPGAPRASAGRRR